MINTSESISPHKISQSVLGVPCGFSTVRDQKTISLCSDYVSRIWDGKKELRALAKSLGVTTGSVCAFILEKKKIDRKPTAVFHAIFENASAMSNLMLEFGATLDKVSNSWVIVCNDDTLSALRDKLSGIFGLIICQEGAVLSIYENQHFREVPKQGVNLYDDMVVVKSCVLRNAFVEARPQEKFAMDAISVFHKEGFIPVKNEFSTKLPWVVAQCHADNGKPRYGMFNTTTCRMDAVTFGHESEGTRVLLSRINSDLKMLQCPPEEIMEIR